jgi:3-methyladenine DNA glycosylase Tag
VIDGTGSAALRQPPPARATGALSKPLPAHSFLLGGPTMMFAVTEAVGIVDTQHIGSRGPSMSDTRSHP